MARTKKAPKAPPIDPRDFDAHATDLLAEIGGQRIKLSPRRYDSGTRGYYGNGKILVEIAGKPVELSGNLQLFVPNTKGCA